MAMNLISVRSAIDAAFRSKYPNVTWHTTTTFNFESGNPEPQLRCRCTVCKDSFYVSMNDTDSPQQCVKRIAAQVEDWVDNGHYECKLLASDRYTRPAPSPPYLERMKDCAHETTIHKDGVWRCLGCGVTVRTNTNAVPVKPKRRGLNVE